MKATDTRSLAGFTGGGYDKGRPWIWQLLWVIASRWLVEPVIWPSRIRVAVLRAFGATIGDRVLVRESVRVHWPWKLTVGDDCWIGAQAWLLNLEPIVIGSDTCVSQAALLCTGSHDRRSPTFEFDNGPITIGSGCWIGCRATVLRGVTVGDRATVGAMALVTKDVPEDALALAPHADINIPAAAHRDHATK